MERQRCNGFSNGKRKIAMLLAMLVCCGILFCQDVSWESDDGYTMAELLHEKADDSDVASWMYAWGFVLVANGFEISDGPDSHIYTRREFMKLPQEIFGDAIKALIDLDYGEVMVSHPDEVRASCVIKLANGKFLVTTVVGEWKEQRFLKE